MPKRQHDIDDDAFDERGLLKDGARVRVPMMMRDGGMSDVQRAVAEAAGVRFDDSACRHQPGPARVVDQAALDARVEAYRQMVRDMDYRTAPKPPAPAADHVMNDREVARVYDTGDPVRDAYLDSVADLTTAWQRKSSALPVAKLDESAVPARPVYDAEEGRRIKAAAYQQMVDEMTSAWKGPAR